MAAAHGRAALVLLMRVAANSGRLSGWMRTSTAAQARCMPPPPPAHPPRVPQAAAAARVAGKDDVWTAATKGDTSLVGDHVLADAKCVNKTEWPYDPPLHERLKMGALVSFYFGRFNSLVLVVETLRSISLPVEGTLRLADCLWRRNLT